jgi:hypothetical protein
MKYLFLALSLLASNVYAEQIITPSDSFNTSESGSAPICKRIMFMKQNVGDLVTGLTTTNFKLYMATHIGESVTATSGKPTNPVSASYSVAPVTGIPGIYNLCVTPTDFSWQLNNVYEFRFWVSKFGDNGSVVLRLQN